MTDSIALRQAWEEHPRYRYRGCAPDVDEPGRAAGNLELTLDAWSGSDREGSEPQKEREARQEAARDVCFGCAVMVQCDAYASSVTAEGRLAEPEGIWGGRTALERHKALIKARHAQPAAPDRRFATPQKRAVLEAFAAVWDPYEVASRAGVDVRTANWQRSNLTTLLGLPRTASRGQLLAAAAERGLLEDVAVVADDGTVPAVPPPTRMPTPPEPVTETPVEPAAACTRAVLPEPGPYEPTRVPRPRRDRFTDIAGQLALWPVEFTEPDTSSLATVHVLFPTPAERLETAV
jgi:hypothetical protein